MISNNFQSSSLNKAILGDSNRSNRIVQMNILHAIYSVLKVIEIFYAKFVYAI